VTDFEYVHIADGSIPEWTVDWGYDSPDHPQYPEEKSWYLGFATEEKAKKFIEIYLKDQPHRLYKGSVKSKQQRAVGVQ
jgi:hypothetical protein